MAGWLEGLFSGGGPLQLGGILGNGGGGILSGQQPLAQGSQPVGFAGGLQNFMQNNPMAILALSAGLMSGKNTQEGMAKGLQGLVAGAPADLAMRKDARTEAEKAAQRKALGALLLAKSQGKEITPEMFMGTGLGDEYAKALIPKPQEPYSLKPGETRYGPDNKPVAVLPEANPVKFSDVSSLRKEVQDLPSYKSYQMSVPAFNSMADALKTSSKASDLDFVYGLARVFDPNSVVREGEMVLVNRTQSLPDQVVGALNAVTGGQQLTPETRQALAEIAANRVKQYEEQYTADRQQFEGIADRYKVNRDDVLPNVVKPRQLSKPVNINGFKVQEVK